MKAKLAFLIKDYLRLTNVEDDGSHVREAVHWLYRAQDATSDRGVSHSYQIGRGWLPSYPETTGYIIPTLMNWCVITGEQEAKRRALEMAEWELGVQLTHGAIPSLTTGDAVVFDTGQVIFGWMCAHAITRDDCYRNAALKAGNWLIDRLDADNTWSSFGNPGYTGLHTYNIRVVWALLQLSEITGEAIFRQRMKGVVDWVLNQERGRGWFYNNCLSDSDRPLLHTIAYTAQGLLECGLLLNDERCIAAVRRTMDELTNCVQPNGRMSGRFDSLWIPQVKWCCLTGMAQTAIVWQRLDRLQGTSRYAEVVMRVLDFLKRTQDLKSNNPGVRGGIKGSHPINGAYGSYRYLNWATKFFIDALLANRYEDNKLPFY